MKLDSAEKWVRRAGAAGGSLFIIVIYLGLWRASKHRKGRTAGHVPPLLHSTYRFYLPASVIGFIMMYLLWRPLKLTLSVPERVLALVSGALLYFAGLILMLWGRFTLGEMYNVSSFLGAELYANHQLITSGPYAFVRHPMYLGGQVAAIGALLIYRTWATLIVAVSLPAIMLRARREEEALSAEFGQQWEDYRRRVPFWVPGIRTIEA